MRLVFDIETDALLDNCTKVHSLVIKNLDTKQVWSCHGSFANPLEHSPSIRQGLTILSEATELWGHNILEFDLPALKKLCGWSPNPATKVRDTQVCARVIWTDIEDNDFRLKNAGILPGRCVGAYTLEAFGYRLGILKGEYGKTADWSVWTPEMQSYCEQDVAVTEALVNKILSKNYSETCFDLEHEFAQIVAVEMCDRGVRFDEPAAAKLYGQLAGRAEELRNELQRVFPPKTVVYYTAKKQLRREKVVEFNPGSRDHVAERLSELGWKFTDFSDKTGKATIDDDVLSNCTLPEAKPLAELFMVNKRLGYLATGNKALLKYVSNGRIHGRVITNGTVTGRCGHSNPNLGQVPRVGSPFGTESRALFIPSEGLVLVGADASGLELRCLAHYLAPFDGGEYIKLVTEGDVHTFNQGVFGLPPGKPGRQLAKNAIYCIIYGGGDEKLGETLVLLSEDHEAAAQSVPLTESQRKRLSKDGPLTPIREANFKRGMYARSRVLKHLKGYAELTEAVATAVFGPVISVSRTGYKVRDNARGRGYLIGLDGRKLHCRSEHSALNTLLQSAGALLVKKATCIWYRSIREAGIPAWLVLHVHDEIQAESAPDKAEDVGKLFPTAVAEAGRFFKFRCPLTGEYKVGKNWAETH